MRLIAFGGLLPVLLLTAGCMVDQSKYVEASAADMADEAPDPTTVIVPGQAPASEATRFLLQDLVEPAVTAGVHETVPVPPLELYPFILRTQEIQTFWMSMATEGTYNDRLRRRNSEVRRLFDRLAQERSWEVRKHQLFQGKDTRCKNSRRGGKKLCPDSLDWSSDYAVRPASIADTQRHFKTRPHVSPANRVQWVIGKTGKGTNHGHVKATAEYTPAKVAAMVEEAKKALRGELQYRGLPTDQVIDPGN